ncbi:hypothetical protein JTB14_018345 [Gonioctena quinquepunctata]|nr:hypothetical protein JTB14_018345 [Gonioctena quinquepunctata]
MDDQSTSRRVCDEKPDLSRSVELGEIDAKEQSFSTTLTASEFEDVEILSSSTSTAPEALTEIQNILKNEPLRKRFKTSTSAASGKLLEIENTPPNVSLLESALSKGKGKSDDESTDTQETFSIPSSSVSSPQVISNPRKRICNDESILKKKNIRYFGDLESDDMEDVKKRSQECRVHSECIFIWNCKRII